MSYDGTDQIPGPGDQPQVPGPAPNARPGQSTASRQLVRDPYSRLGGVASGLAHYFGLDVSIVRLGFVLFTVFSGVGLVVYLLAWLVVPRAEYWPPSAVSRAHRSLTAREIGIGLAVLGALLFLFFSGGGTARVLVPVLLVAGGVWLLRQPEAAPPQPMPAPGPDTDLDPLADPFGDPLGFPAPDEPTRVFESTDPTLVGDPFAEASPAPAPSVTPPTTAASPIPPPTPPSSEAGSPSAPFSSPGAPQPADTLAAPPVVPPPAAGPPPVGAPVPPRRRRWRRVVIPLLVLFVFLPLLLIALVVGLLLGNGISIDGGFDSVYRPATVEQIPDSIDQDAGELELDLTLLDPEDFAGETDLPIDIDIDMGLGEVRVIVPEGLDLAVDAEADLGDVAVFGRSEDGIDNDVTVDAETDDPVIDLEIRLGVGQVVVERG